MEESNMTQHQPTSAQCRAVAARFRNVAREFPEGAISMLEPDVRAGSTLCKTVACHGGYYSLACFLEGRDGFMTDTGALFSGEDSPTADIPDYSGGARQLAMDLGFEGCSGFSPEIQLQQWAEEHPDEWGNQYGGGMFDSGGAFDADHHGETLAIVDFARWWEGVGSRIEAGEAKAGA